MLRERSYKLTSGSKEGEYRVHVEGNQGTNLHWKISDFKGQILAGSEVNLRDGKSFEIDAAHLPRGNYILSISEEEMPTRHLKLVV